MSPEMGELLVGAYLKVIEGCDVVSYGVRHPGGGLKGLKELDVVGLRFHDRTAFLCEVTTHIGGMLIVDKPKTIETVTKKHRAQITYAKSHLRDFPNRRFQMWSPVVGPSVLAGLQAQPDLQTLEKIVNGTYTEKINGLRVEAKKKMNDENNDAFRLLQILEHLRPLPSPTS